MARLVVVPVWLLGGGPVSRVWGRIIFLRSLGGRRGLRGEVGGVV